VSTAALLPSVSRSQNNVKDEPELLTDGQREMEDAYPLIMAASAMVDPLSCFTF
jgi:hypothetical protein